MGRGNNHGIGQLRVITESLRELKLLKGSVDAAIEALVMEQHENRYL